LAFWRKPPPSVIGVVIPPPPPTWWKVHRNEVLTWCAAALFAAGLFLGWDAADWSGSHAAADTNCTTPAPSASRGPAPSTPVHVPPSKGAR
jgi:hypothetical protein